MASGMMSTTMTRCSPKKSTAIAPSRRGDIERGDVVRVTTTSSITGSSISSIAAASLSANMATTPTSLVKVNESGNGARSASSRPGLWAASTSTVG